MKKLSLKLLIIFNLIDCSDNEVGVVGEYDFKGHIR
mgnify:CR=1 FL=1